MSKDIVSTACAEEADHRFLRQSLAWNLDRVSINSQTGCQICGLVYRALEAVHEDLGMEVTANSRFQFWGQSNNTFTTSVAVGGPQYFVGQTEIVYEVEQLRTSSNDKFSPENSIQILPGEYSALRILPGRKIPRCPEQSVSLMRSWIQECMKNHTKCRSEDIPILPKRVIDVGTSHEDNIKLHETNGQRGFYVALSHQWGKSELLTTRSTTINARKERISWTSLSRTFQDSITLTRRLGVRYIWIDSICIVQDDPVDWEIESAKMADVYENSYVTISANTSNGMLLGDSVTRKVRSRQLEAVEMNGTTVPLVLRPRRDHNHFFASSMMESVGQPDQDLDAGYPLFKRAWCFQERFLATRILHFTDSEVVFECKSVCDCECGGIIDKVFLKSHFASLMSRSGKTSGEYEMTPWDGWTAIVNQYVRKDVTYPIDILPALAGIASRVDCDELGRYVAGLWEKHLSRGIFWFAHVSFCSGSDEMTAPSFSWASLAGSSKANEVTWPHSLDEGVDKQLFDIVEVICEAGTHNPFGVVTRGSIRLRGYLLNVTLTAQKGPSPVKCIMRCGDLEHGASVFIDRVTMLDLTTERTLVCFFGFQRGEQNSSKDRKEHESDFCVLLLEQVEEGTYRRVGCCPYLLVEIPWLERATYQEFSLV